jgi:hypothetical protein
MKKLFDTLILLAVLVGADWLGEATGLFEKPSRLAEVSIFLFFTLLYFLISTNLTYRVFFDLQSRMYRILAFILICLAVSMFLADRTLAVTRLWHYAIRLQRSIDPHLYRDNDHFGYRPVPGAEGFYEYYIGDSIHGRVPVKFDSKGFRTSFAPQAARDTADLYLGCSFTFGDFIPYEQTYPYKASSRMGHQSVNAGLSGYGLAQMLQLADSIIPSRRFRYVFIQMSYWLVDRAVAVNRTTLYGYKGVPYLSLGDDGPRLHYPSYRTVFDQKAREWNLGPKHYGRKLLFLVTDGWKIELVDYPKYMLIRVAMRLGLLPRPASDKRALEVQFYDHVIQLARRNGAIPVIIRMSYPDEQGPADLLGRLREKVPVADVDKAMADSCARLGKTSRELYQLHHPSRSGPIHFDGHPNPAMTDLVSDVILKTVRGLPSQ